MAWHDTWAQMKQKPKPSKTAKKAPKPKKGTTDGLADRRRS